MPVSSKVVISVSHALLSLCPHGLTLPCLICWTLHHYLAGSHPASPPAFHPSSGPPRHSPFSPPSWSPLSRISSYSFAPFPAIPPLPFLFLLFDLLSPLPADSHSGSRRLLLSSHREFKLLLVWKVPRLASPAFVIFGHLEGGVRRWLRRLHPTASSAKFRRLLESVALPFGVLEPFLLDARFYCPTLSANRSGHPIRLCDFSFFTLRHLWTLFGFPLSDPLYSVLRHSFSAPQVCFLSCFPHVYFCVVIWCGVLWCVVVWWGVVWCVG